LSIKSVVASVCGNLISSNIDQTYKIDLPASHTAANSALVVDNATLITGTKDMKERCSQL
jgi:hypothetical protein